MSDDDIHSSSEDDSATPSSTSSSESEVEGPGLNYDDFELEEAGEGGAGGNAVGGEQDDVLHGRPITFIDMEFVAFMRDNFIKWNVIADHLNVSRNTLRRRCQKEGYVENKPFADNDTITQLITDFHRLHPNEGKYLYYLLYF
jgi:hypothetical protein